MLQAIFVVCIALFSVRTTISNPTFLADINPKRGAAVRPTVGTEIARRRQGFACQLKSHWRPAMEVFFDLCELPRLKKKPSTSQLLDWLQLLIVDELPAEALGAECVRMVLPRMHGALLKSEQDVHLFERLIFLHKQQSKRR